MECLDSRVSETMSVLTYDHLCPNVDPTDNSLYTVAWTITPAILAQRRSVSSSAKALKVGRGHQCEEPAEVALLGVAPQSLQSIPCETNA
ncbi:hypothetical protein Hamer_G004735 [Homarus americanus]|uniref:Uncharacterized protein n=1 Tax=Homarus americanus TaxID=6706 RepID=A0A8J5K1V3_HOMAM|nr:hypothetical protein Hamer_G004735 [Homarus americanus]